MGIYSCIYRLPHPFSLCIIIASRGSISACAGAPSSQFLYSFSSSLGPLGSNCSFGSCSSSSFGAGPSRSLGTSITLGSGTCSSLGTGSSRTLHASSSCTLSLSTISTSRSLGACACSSYARGIRGIVTVRDILNAFDIGTRNGLSCGLDCLACQD